jgi:hypothetical protein
MQVGGNRARDPSIRQRRPLKIFSALDATPADWPTPESAK